MSFIIVEVETERPIPVEFSMVCGAFSPLNLERRIGQLGSVIPMHGLRRECRQADGDVFCAVGIWRAVLHPFADASDDSLPGFHVEHTSLVRHAERAFEHNAEFIELRRLTRFDPAARTAHVRDAESRFTGDHPSDEFLDDLRFVACRGDTSGR